MGAADTWITHGNRCCHELLAIYVTWRRCQIGQGRIKSVVCTIQDGWDANLGERQHLVSISICISKRLPQLTIGGVIL
jgi:hypothetical protein